MGKTIRGAMGAMRSRRLDAGHATAEGCCGTGCEDHLENMRMFERNESHKQIRMVCVVVIGLALCSYAIFTLESML